jgi:hypothetical protein
MVTVTNPNAVRVKLSRLQVCLPKGFVYVTRSITGDVRRAPTMGRCGSGRKAVQLTWKTILVPGSGKLRFQFTVRSGRVSATLVGSVTGTADGGFAITPASAKTTVLAQTKR